jgi:ubiquinone/menaquinone biosynthesis C-methylase UbiE
MNIKNAINQKKFFKNIHEVDLIEAHKADDLYYISKYRKTKLLIKRLIISLINFIFNKKINYSKARDLENVKKKYDEISGTYIKEFEKENTSYLAFNHFDKKNYIIKGNQIDHPSNFISNFCKEYSLNSIFEVGAGELTTLFPIVKDHNFKFVSALDLSAERLKKGLDFFNINNLKIDSLISGNATKLPYTDNSFDLVFSHYCLEQVPLLSKKIIDEMIRVSSKYIIFIEPSYEFSNEYTRNKILIKGYPIFRKKMFENSFSKIIYRDGMPFSRCVNYAELVILEKNNKTSGNPKVIKSKDCIYLV